MAKRYKVLDPMLKFMSGKEVLEKEWLPSAHVLNMMLERGMVVELDEEETVEKKPVHPLFAMLTAISEAIDEVEKKKEKTSKDSTGKEFAEKAHTKIVVERPQPVADLSMKTLESDDLTLTIINPSTLQDPFSDEFEAFIYSTYTEGTQFIPLNTDKVVTIKNSDYISQVQGGLVLYKKHVIAEGNTKFAKIVKVETK